MSNQDDDLVDTNDDARNVLGRVLKSVLPTSSYNIAEIALHEIGSISELLSASRMRLLRVPGMTPAAVDLIRGISEVATRAAYDKIVRRRSITSSEELYDYLNITLRCKSIETVRGLFLDAGNGLIKDEEIACGTVSRVVIFPREVARIAIDLHAAAVILAHSHPSGDPSPSRQDIDATKALISALASLQIVFHDHVIVGRNQIISMRGTGLI